MRQNPQNSNPLSTISDTTRPAPRYAATRSLQAPSRASCIVSRKSSGAGDQKVIFNAKILDEIISAKEAKLIGKRRL